MCGRYALHAHPEVVALQFNLSEVPASGFYEWQAAGRGKQPYYFRPQNEPLFGFAALWEHDTCSLITTEPNEVIRKVHDRMPLIVPADSYAAWLAGDEALLERPPGIDLVSHPVGLAVNAAANDSPRLIEPVELAPGLFD